MLENDLSSFTLWIGAKEHISEVPLGHVWQGVDVVPGLEKQHGWNFISTCTGSNVPPTLRSQNLINVTKLHF